MSASPASHSFAKSTSRSRRRSEPRRSPGPGSGDAVQLTREVPRHVVGRSVGPSSPPPSAGRGLRQQAPAAASLSTRDRRHFARRPGGYPGGSSHLEVYPRFGQRCLDRGRRLSRVEVPTLSGRTTSTWSATPAPRDLPHHVCRLDELGLGAVGHHFDADRSVDERRVVDDDPWCRTCGAGGVSRETVVRRLVHEPLGFRLTDPQERVHRYRWRSLWGDLAV